MNKHEFSKEEIATYLRDYDWLLITGCHNQNVPLYKLFRYIMEKDMRLQYSIRDYYKEMVNIYEFFLISKYLTILYDNKFDYLSDNKINSINISNSIFVNSSDYGRFSKKQIIKYIRNAFNHNDNKDNDLVKFIRVNENNKEIIKAEIFLKNTNPIPFHVELEIKDFLSIACELNMANTITGLIIKSNGEVNLNYFNVNETFNNVFAKRCFSRKKLTEEQLENIAAICDKNYVKNKEVSFLLSENGVEYKDFKYTAGQKEKIREDLLFWEKMGEIGNDVLFHLATKTLPLSYAKIRSVLMNIILTDYYVKNGNYTLFDIVEGARKVYLNKQCDSEFPFSLYTDVYGIDKNILYDAFDFDNLVSITSAIYYGYIFDSLVTDEVIKITDTKEVEREKIRDSFVHMRHYEGVNGHYKLFDWGNGIDKEFNSKADGFWSTNVTISDMLRCTEKYYKLAIANRDMSKTYMDMPIHIRVDGTSKESVLSFIKEGVYYSLLFDEKFTTDKLKLVVCDSSQKEREPNKDEIELFINELDNFTDEERKMNEENIDKINSYLLGRIQRSNLKGKV